MTADEKDALESTPTIHGQWWIPAQWFSQLVMVARKEGKIGLLKMLAFKMQFRTNPRRFARKNAD
jgi:hypothetical protein